MHQDYHAGYVFGIFPVPMFILLSITSLIVIAGIVYVVVTMIRNGAAARRESRLPEQSEHARVVTKRTSVWGDHASTWYYVTFELDSRERIELAVSDRDYGMLAEGDDGLLIHKGRIFVGFTRS